MAGFFAPARVSLAHVVRHDKQHDKQHDKHVHENSEFVSIGFAALAFRAGDGLEISLLWDSINAVFVAVLDRKRGARTSKCQWNWATAALDVFRHPFAYQRSSSTAKLPRDALRVTVAAERGGT